MKERKRKMKRILCAKNIANRKNCWIVCKQKEKRKKKIISSHTSVSRIAIARWNYILQLYS